MTGADVNLSARLDGVGSTVRQKLLIDRVSAVLCDGLADDPSDVWNGWANLCRDVGLDVLADRLVAVADLIAAENL